MEVTNEESPYEDEGFSDYYLTEIGEPEVSYDFSGKKPQATFKNNFVRRRAGDIAAAIDDNINAYLATPMNKFHFYDVKENRKVPLGRSLIGYLKDTIFANVGGHRLELSRQNPTF